MIIADVLRQYDDLPTILSSAIHQNIIGYRFPGRCFTSAIHNQIRMGAGLPLDARHRTTPVSVSLQPNQVTLNQFSTFLQDEISLFDIGCRSHSAPNSITTSSRGFELSKCKIDSGTSLQINLYLDRSITRRPGLGPYRGRPAV